MKNSSTVAVALFVLGLLFFGFIVYKQAFPTPAANPPIPLLGIDRDMKRVGDHQELLVRGTIVGYVSGRPNPRQGTLSDSFELDSDRVDNAGFGITGSLLTLRNYEGKYVEVLLKFPLEYKASEREILSIKEINHP